MRSSSTRFWIGALVAMPTVLALLGQTIRAQQPPVDAKVMAYGKHLARECTGCHRIDGTDNGIPSITGQAADEFSENMKYYQSGARNNPAMVSVAQSLNDDQIKALAAFYGSLPKGPRAK